MNSKFIVSLYVHCVRSGIEKFMIPQTSVYQGALLSQNQFIGVVFSSPIILRALQIQIQSFSLRKLGIRSSKAFRSKKGQIPKTYYFTFTVGLFPSLNTIIDE